MPLSVTIEDFGEAPLIAEHDAERGAIRVNARAVERARARGGEAAAEALIACAVAHERHHAAFPQEGEEAAHAAARLVTGYDPRALEALAWGP